LQERLAQSRRGPPREPTFPQHIEAFLGREHGHGMPEQTEIAETEHFFADDRDGQDRAPGDD
jgi:hypothetical protein